MFFASLARWFRKPASRTYVRPEKRLNTRLAIESLEQRLTPDSTFAAVVGGSVTINLSDLFATSYLADATAVTVENSTLAEGATMNVGGGTLTHNNGGTVNDETDDSFTFTSDGVFAGQVNFKVDLLPNGQPAAETVHINVVAAPPSVLLPVATSDSASTLEDIAVTTGDVLANDFLGNTPTTITAYTQGSNGSVAYNNDGTFTYTPAANFNGSDSFNYTITDNDGDTSTATVSVTVSPVNDAPIISSAPNYFGVEGDDNPVYFYESDIDVTDPDNAQADLTYTWSFYTDNTFSVLLGTETLFPNNVNDYVKFSFPDDGSYYYTVEVSDGAGGTAFFDPDVTIENLPPTAVDDSADVNEDGPAAVVDALGNDSDPAGPYDPLTITGVSLTTNGGIATTDGSTVTYDPNGAFDYLGVGETAIDTFTYTISDGDGGEDEATVTVTIHGQNDAPEITIDGDGPTVVNEGDALVVRTGSFFDVDGDALIVSIDSTLGTFSVNYDDASNSSGTWSWSYDPEDDLAATAFMVTADDGVAAPAAVGFSLTVLNVDPTLTVDSSSLTTDDCNTTFTVAGTFADPGTDSYRIVINWGDGQTTEYVLPDDATFPLDAGTGVAGMSFLITGDHTYATHGVYNVTVSVEDDDAGSDSASLGTAIVADTASVSGGILDVHGTDLNDVITVNQNIENGQLVYKVHGKFYDALTNSIVSTVTFATNGISLIRIHLCDGNDLASVAGDITTSAAIYGDGGKDHINGGGGNDVLVGGLGDDMIDGGGGNDVLVGGLGNDRLVGNVGNDILVAGAFESGSLDEYGEYLMLRAQSDFWNSTAVTIGANATGGQTIEDTLDQDITDTDKDTLTGSSGADLFLVAADDTVTDIGTFKKATLDGDENKEGDVVQIVM
jgi:large repetitive protein